MNMFREVFRTQWKWSWLPLAFVSVAAFALPILSIQFAYAADEMWQGPNATVRLASELLAGIERWSVLYTVLAALLGLSLATLAWSADHRGRHVYALTLPVPRWHYVIMRFGSGVSLLLIPAVLVAISGLLAAGSIELPEGITAYPVALAFRFFLASLVAYAMFFAISAGTARSAAFVLAPIAVLIVADLTLALLGVKLSVGNTVANWIFAWPGPMEIFTGRWLLIDV